MDYFSFKNEQEVAFTLSGHVERIVFWKIEEEEQDGTGTPCENVWEKSSKMFQEENEKRGPLQKSKNGSKKNHNYLSFHYLFEFWKI